MGKRDKMMIKIRVDRWRTSAMLNQDCYKLKSKDRNMKIDAEYSNINTHSCLKENQNTPRPSEHPLFCCTYKQYM